MPRIRFSADDLGRVRFAQAPDPLWEMRLSAQILKRVGTPHRLVRWRSGVVRTMPREALPYLHLTPLGGAGPDFLTPEAGAGSFDDGVDEVLSTPPDRLRAELTGLTVHPVVASWAGELSRGSRQALELLRASMTAYFHHVVAPSWGTVHGAVTSDLAMRARAMATDGVERTLSSLHPGARYGALGLDLDGAAGDPPIDLGGRGLRILPVYFCHGVTVSHAGEPSGATLAIPAADDGATGADRDEALGALLGRTRATALRIVQAATPTTTALATTLGIAPASASEHASVLRAAGLIASERDGRRMVHRITGLGARMLAGSAPTAGPGHAPVAVGDGERSSRLVPVR